MHTLILKGKSWSRKESAKKNIVAVLPILFVFLTFSKTLSKENPLKSYFGNKELEGGWLRETKHQVGRWSQNTRFQTSRGGSSSEFLRWIKKKKSEPKWSVLQQELNYVDLSLLSNTLSWFSSHLFLWLWIKWWRHSERINCSFRVLRIGKRVLFEYYYWGLHFPGVAQVGFASAVCLPFCRRGCLSLTMGRHFPANECDWAWST